MSWQDRFWAGFEWSKWAPLSSLQSSDLPKGKGIYRIRSGSPRLMVYAGQGSLRGRVAGNWKQASQEDYHDFNRHESPKLHFLALNRERLGGYEASWTKGPLDLSSPRRREAHEDRVLWCYRQEARESSLANYSRTAVGLDIVGRDEHNIGTKNPLPASSQPVETSGHPASSPRWMGLRWSNLASREELKQGGQEADGFRLNQMQSGPALYKALTPRLRLRKVGYIRSPTTGVFRVFRDLPEDTLLSWSNLYRLTPRHHCLELVSDLIGAHLAQTSDVPACQF